MERLWQDPELRRIVFDKARFLPSLFLFAPFAPPWIHFRSKVKGAKSDTEGPAKATVITVNGGDPPIRKALAPSASDNFCIVGVTASLPRPTKAPNQGKAVKNYGLV